MEGKGESVEGLEIQPEPAHVHHVPVYISPATSLQHTADNWHVKRSRIHQSMSHTGFTVIITRGPY